MHLVESFQVATTENKPDLLTAVVKKEFQRSHECEKTTISARNILSLILLNVGESICDAAL